MRSGSIEVAGIEAFKELGLGPGFRFSKFPGLQKFRDLKIRMPFRSQVYTHELWSNLSHGVCIEDPIGE